MLNDLEDYNDWDCGSADKTLDGWIEAQREIVEGPLGNCPI